MTYVRNACYVAGWAHDIAAARTKGVRILNDPIVMWHNTLGDIVAFMAVRPSD